MTSSEVGPIREPNERLGIERAYLATINWPDHDSDQPFCECELYMADRDSATMVFVSIREARGLIPFVGDEVVIIYDGHFAMIEPRNGGNPQ